MEQWSWGIGCGGLEESSESAVCSMAPIVVRGVNGVCPSLSWPERVGGLTISQPGRRYDTMKPRRYRQGLYSPSRQSAIWIPDQNMAILAVEPIEYQAIGGIGLHFLVAPLFALLIKLQNNGPHINKRGKLFPGRALDDGNRKCLPPPRPPLLIWSSVLWKIPSAWRL